MNSFSLFVTDSTYELIPRCVTL